MHCGVDATFHYETFSAFRGRRPRVPLCNRDFIQERVATFVETLIRTNGKAYLGVLHCAVLVGRDEELLVCDGQHRFLALQECLTTHGVDAGVPFVIRKCVDEAALRAYYRDLNNVFISQDLVLEETDLLILERFKAYLQEHYARHVSHAARPRFPNVNADALANVLMQRVPAPRTYAAVLEHADALNTHLGSALKVAWPKLYHAALKKQGLFLAFLFAKTDQECVRAALPKAVRNAVWRRAFPDATQGTCFVCDCAIDAFSFHAGHIVAAAHGGKAVVDNLTPLCACCNTSMGTMNACDFKTRFFPGKCTPPVVIASLA